MLTWPAGLRERPAPRLCPRPPAVPVQPPSRSWRRPRSGACARWAGPARSHFRRAGGSAVPGRCSARRPAVGAGDAGRRSREAPEAGLCRLPRERQVGGGGGRRWEQASVSLGGLRVPPKRRRLGCPRPKLWGWGGSARVPDRARVGAEAGSSAWESGTWGPRTAPRHLRDLRQVTLPFWVLVPCCQVGETLGSSWL